MKETIQIEQMKFASRIKCRFGITSDKDCMNADLVKVYYRKEPTFYPNPELTGDQEMIEKDYQHLITFYIPKIGEKGRLFNSLRRRNHQLEEIFRVMQGEIWSPNGEARTLIRALGLHHTSMSAGDLIEFPDSHEWYECQSAGWKKLGGLSEDHGKPKGKVAK